MEHFLQARHGRQDRAGRRRAAGFTLVELLVTFVIAAVLVALAVPAMTGFLAEQSAAANADELAGHLRLARSEAIKRSASVSVCSSNDGQACADDAWAGGWIVVVGGGSVLRAQNSPPKVDSATGTADTITFSSNGLVLTGAGTVSFVPVGGDATRQRNVNVDIQGRVSITKGEIDAP